MLVEAEDACAVGLRVTTNPLEDGGAVVDDDMAHDVDLGFVPGDELTAVPDVCSGLWAGMLRSRVEG